MNQYIKERVLPQGDLALKRRRIQQEAAVITHEDFTNAVEEVKRLSNELKMKPKKKPGRPPKAANKKSTPAHSEEDTKEYPSPLPLKQRVTKRPKTSAIILRSPRPSSSSSSDESQRPTAAIVDDYVLLKFIPEGKKRIPAYYVGCVTSHTLGSDSWTIQVMRRNRSSVNQFVFPDQSDIATYSQDDIVRVLRKPKCIPNRGVYCFSDDFSDFHTSLR